MLHANNVIGSSDGVRSEKGRDANGDVCECNERTTNSEQ